MLDLISSGRNTQLHDFSTLETKYTYSHFGNEVEDFNYFSDVNVFLSINRKSGFELLRTCYKNEVYTIQRMKKRPLDELSCGTCSSIGNGDIALGLTSGHIQFFNIHTGDFCATKFKPERPNNGVVNLAYSNCDEILAGIYENGDINLYGLKTHVKMDTFKLDQQSLLLRFHPLKRFHLGIVSSKGALSIMDSQSKRIIYQDKIAHLAPCPDFSWSPIATDTLVTVGYDCKLNVFDIRKKSILTQVTHQYPYSTVSISSCGRYCCAGSLKGDIIAYDFRSFKTPLATRHAHESSVVRLAFVPQNTNKSQVSQTTDISVQSVDHDSKKNSPNDFNESELKKDSFNELLEVFCTNYDEPHWNKPVTEGKKPRDSIFDMDLKMGNPEINYSGESAINNCVAVHDSMNISALRLKRNSGVSLKHHSNLSLIKNTTTTKPLECSHIAEESLCDSSVQKRNKYKQNKRMCMIPSEINPTINQLERSSRDESSNVSLKNVLQESTANNHIDLCSPITVSLNQNGTLPDKENKIQNKKESDVFKEFVINDKYSSTPNQIRHKHSNTVEKNAAPKIEECASCHSKIINLEKRIEERFDQLQGNIQKSEREIRNHLSSSTLSVLSNIWAIDETDIKDIRDGVVALVRGDEFVQHYMQLRSENEELRRKLSELSTK